MLAVVVMLAALVLASSAEAKTARGTARGDTLNGTRLADRLDGRGGPDRIDGRAGNDVLDGGAGNDRVQGGAGDDVVRGGGGNDLLLTGGAGKDRIEGGDGDDRIEAADGVRDVIVCGAGLDTVVVDRLDRVAADCEVPHRLVLATSGSGRGAIREVAGGVLCPPLCVRDLDYGIEVALQPEPEEGSLFAGWTGDCLGAGVPCRLTLTADRSATALFALRQVPVAVERTGAGTGSVAIPQVIDCGATCSAIVGWGATLVLTATPADGSVFAGWSGDCAGLDPVCVLPARDDVLVAAAFEPVPPTPIPLRRLTVVRPLAGGTITSAPAGIDCAPLPAAGRCQAEFPQDSTVVLTATPAAGQVHAGWTGVCSQVTARTCTVVMIADAEAGADFMAGRTLRVVPTVPVSFLGPAVVSQEVPPLISCPGMCEADYRVNANVTLNVVSPLSLLFTWTTGPCGRTARTCVVPLTAPGTTSVAFSLLP